MLNEVFRENRTPFPRPRRICRSVTHGDAKVAPVESSSRMEISLVLTLVRIVAALWNRESSQRESTHLRGIPFKTEPRYLGWDSASGTPSLRADFEEFGKIKLRPVEHESSGLRADRKVQADCQLSHQRGELAAHAEQCQRIPIRQALFTLRVQHSLAGDPADVCVENQGRAAVDVRQG